MRRSNIIFILLFLSSPIFALHTSIDTCGFQVILETKDILCKGNNNGSASISILNGVEPYQYYWSNNDTTDNISFLSSGDYYVIVSDSTNCIDTTHFSISEPSEIFDLELTVNTPECNGYSGSFVANISGGTAPYTYKWSTGSNLPTISSQGYGTYSVTVSDINSCTKSESVSIAMPCNLVISPVVTNVSCKGGSDGEIRFEYVSGCLFGYLDYCISGYSCGPDNTFGNLPPGTYSCLVSVGNCYRQLTAIVEEPEIDPVAIGEVNVNNINCMSEYGSASIIGNSGAAPYSYSWSNGTQTSFVDSLEAGSYSFTISDTSDCTVEDSIEIGKIKLSLGEDRMIPIKCPNNYHPIILNPLVEKSGNNYLMEWKDIANDSIIISSNENLTIDSAGTYFFIATDTLNNCVYSDTISISENIVYEGDSLISNPVITNPTDGLDNGIIMSNITGGSFPFVFEWDTGAGTSVLNSLGTGIYNLTLTEKFGCTETFTYELENVSNVSKISNNEIEVFPNPSSGLIQIELKNTNLAIKEITIFDAFGHISLTEKISKQNGAVLQLKQPANGVYFLKVEFQNNQFVTKRIIISN